MNLLRTHMRVMLSAVLAMLLLASGWGASACDAACGARMMDRAGCHAMAAGSAMGMKDCGMPELARGTTVRAAACGGGACAAPAQAAVVREERGTAIVLAAVELPGREMPWPERVAADGGMVVEIARPPTPAPPQFQMTLRL